jgi:hypothetical protein
MDMYIATEEAYKNGYDKGYEDCKLIIKKIVFCTNCKESDTVSCPNGKVWCDKMCRYMNKNSFCSEGVERI